MQNSVTAQVIQVGDAYHVIIPDEILAQLEITNDNVQMTLFGREVQIKDKKHPREGWEEQIAAISANDGDELLIPDNLGNKFDDEGWTW